MPDTKQSALSLSIAQQILDSHASALRTIDRQLERLARDLDTGDDDLLAHEIVGTVGAVRRDLLADAIETLSKLATVTEADVLADRERVTYFDEATS